eukprot:992067-Rhodomonas_salina.2
MEQKTAMKKKQEEDAAASNSRGKRPDRPVEQTRNKRARGWNVVGLEGAKDLSCCRAPRTRTSLSLHTLCSTALPTARAPHPAREGGREGGREEGGTEKEIEK